MPLQLSPTQMLGLSILKWLGKMKDTNYMGFSSPCRNTFFFQWTILLDMGLDVL